MEGFMHISVKDRNCLVVGASSGIGFEVASAYVSSGANVIIASSNSVKLDAALKQLQKSGGKGKLFSVPVDISSPHQIENLVKQAVEKLGSIEIYTNCVGISVSETIMNLEEDDWDRVMDVNLKAAYLLAKSVSRIMIEKKVRNGKILNISSIAGKIGEFGNGAYSVSKAGLNSLTQVLARELGPHGICAVSVCPGYTKTELLKEALATRAPLEGKTPEEYTAELAATVSLKRFAEPEEIADAILFLSSDHANYITGVTLTIDGGKTLL